MVDEEQPQTLALPHAQTLVQAPVHSAHSSGNPNRFSLIIHPMTIP